MGALDQVREATLGTPFEGDLYLVGGAVRDAVLGLPSQADFDLVTRGSAADLALHLYRQGLSTIPPVTYERFGTAMVRIAGADVEIVTARRESYEAGSRKPIVEPASYQEDAARRDFTVNTLMRGLHDERLVDPLGRGLPDLEARILRTPLNPVETFRDDPLRMLRAVRFRWKLDFIPAPGLYEAIRAERKRLVIVSHERIRDEWVKMLKHPSGPDALNDLRQLGLLEVFAPELLPMVGCQQGDYHHLDVWDHSLLVLRNAGCEDLTLALAALLHDVGKPETRRLDGAGQIRFFGHEHVGADLARRLLQRLRFTVREVETVVRLVRNHMRLGSAPSFTPAAARRLIRDLDGELERLLQLVEADASSLAPGVRVLDLGPIREQVAEILSTTTAEKLDSPLSGSEIMAIRGLAPGPEVGRFKAALTELVIEGVLQPDDRVGAERALRAMP